MLIQMAVALRVSLFLSLALLFSGSGLGQTEHGVTNERAADWKESQLEKMGRQLEAGSSKGARRRELVAQKAWLTGWTPGRMATTPKPNRRLPKARLEPQLKSAAAEGLRKGIVIDSLDRDADELSVLRKGLTDHPDDLAVHQLVLRWMDHPVRRKKFLNEIDTAATCMIDLSKKEERSDATFRLATEFAMYRRARALAYRELPDVVAVSPIEDARQLDAEIVSAYEDLVDVAGKGRSEFILLEIRILRREKMFGQALSLLEEYGSAINPKWYLKKRRDLLKELDWEFPYAAGARLYAEQFPEEVAKEKAIGSRQD